jgi:L-histidine N-alpha-methyltransferase
MTHSVQVTIHPSQFPENVRRDLLASLRTRRVNHKFHYDSVKQTQKWLALHEAHSPARRDKNCLTTYDAAFIAATKSIKTKSVRIIGLGCGGGQKDVQLMKQLQSCGKKISYAPCDVSVAMVLVARKAALDLLPAKKCFPFVCDLATTDDLSEAFSKDGMPQGASLVTFFGMIPNFEPRQILPKLTELLRPDDFLLFSANLAPGKDCSAGMEKILPQYDNPLTRDWLSSFLFDLGVEAPDGQLRFSIEAGGMGLRRVVARFHFRCTRKIKVGGEEFSFARGETIRLFFSYRYLPARVRKLLERHGLEISGAWIANSEEEGVFLCRRK